VTTNDEFFMNACFIQLLGVKLQPWVDFFTHETMIHPVTDQPEHKRSFIPSKWERKRVSFVLCIMLRFTSSCCTSKESNYYHMQLNSNSSDVGC
jgi:BOP1NT (NUC169) domain